jgi:hypothetical protein
MAEPKTKRNDQSVTAFLDQVEDEKRRADGYTILEMMRKISGAEPQMWGDSIIGFSSYHYKYASGREGDWPQIAFSPRKQNLTIYLGPCIGEHHAELLARLGKHKVGKSCLYINRLSDVDPAVLTELITQSLG